jgi:hypothetical protein
MILVEKAKMNKEYPSHYSGTALMSTMGAIQASVERDLSRWKLGWNIIRLLTVADSIYIQSYFSKITN